MLRAARTHTTVMGVPLGSRVVLQHRYFASAHTRVDRWSLIEFRNSASPGGVKQLGIVLERKRSLQRSKTKKFSLIVKAENDKLFTIPERDVTYQWPTGVDVADESLLQKTRERINNLMDSVPAAKIQRLWEAHSQRTKAVSLPVDKVSKRLFYSADPLHIYAAHKLLETNKLYFRRRHAQWKCRSAQKVKQKKKREDRMLRDAKKEDRFLCRLRRLMMRNLERDPSPEIKLPPLPSKLEECWQELNETERWEFTPNQRKRLDVWRRDVAAQLTTPPEKEDYMDRLIRKSKLDEGTAEEVDELQVLAGAKSSNPAYVVKLMTRLGLFKDVDDLDALQSKLRLEFSKKEEEEAQQLVNIPPTDIPNRTDFRDLVAVAVDPADALERDDAYSVAEKDGEHWILVHIADATRWIKLGSVLDKTAHEKGSAIYLAGGRKVNMIPPSLSREHMALSSSRDNYAITFAARLGEDGSLAEYRVLPSLLAPVRITTYDELDSVLRDVDHPEHSRSHFSAAYTLAMKRQNYRIKRGAQFLDLSNAVHRKVDPAYLATGGRPPKGSKMMIQEFLLLAGEIAATFADDKNLPFLYRKQGQPKEANNYFSYLMRPPSTDSELVRVYKLRTMTQPQDLSRDCNVHFSLALSKYSPINAPLRRYGDLLLHYQIKALLEGSEPLEDYQLQSRLVHLKERLKAIDILEEVSKRRWVIRYFEQRKEEKHHAVVVDLQPVIAGGNMISDSRATVVFPNLPKPHDEWQCILDVPKNTKCGATVLLRVEKAHSLTNALEFRLG